MLNVMAAADVYQECGVGVRFGVHRSLVFVSESESMF